jgi:DNA uptake protein ComE-like DNA-binding protein
MKRFLFCFLSVAMLTSAGCTPAQRNPDNLQRDAAKTTSEVTKDAKAVVKGVEEGLKAKGSVDINKATADELEALPGIHAAEAHRMIANRPYKSADDLVKRHVLSQAKYAGISGQIEAD